MPWQQALDTVLDAVERTRKSPTGPVVTGQPGERRLVRTIRVS